MMKKTSRQTMRSEQIDAGINLHKPCSRASEWEMLLYDVAEGIADRETAAAVRQHIGECAYCRAALSDIRRMTAAMQAGMPKPKPGLHTRIMAAVSAEEEENGRVLTETVDLRTGRVLSDPARMRGIAGAVGGVAAALLVVIGFVYLLPFLRVSSGTTSGAQEIIGEMQDIIGNPFSDGVFVGTAEQPTTEDVYGGFDVIGSDKSSAPTVDPIVDPTVGPTVQQDSVVMDVWGADRTEILRLLEPLSASDESRVSFTVREDGIFVSPLSVYREAAALLDAANLTVVISQAGTTDADIMDGADNMDGADIMDGDSFYIRICD